MGWRLFQVAIAFLVIASNIKWQWTDNAVLAAGSGVGMALMCTIWLAWLVKRHAEWKARRIRHKESLQEIEMRRGDRLRRDSRSPLLPDR